MGRARTSTADGGVAAVDDEGDAPLREARTKPGAVAVAERVIQNGAGQPVVLNEDQGVVKRASRRNRGTAGFELLRDVQRNQGLILDDED